MSSQSTEDAPSDEETATRAFPPEEIAGPAVEPQQQEIDSQVGNAISRYVVLEEVGLGGMGHVLRAYDPRLQREVAVKILRANTLSDEASVRLVNEARAMAKMSHPRVWIGAEARRGKA